ncbi:lantibiotic dehydratase [Streptomyces sp. NPDC056352]|uniref:lantibiotic dehydratase n=1 Tax=Streptomyces sp. NPDC056352 TaxID=3345791 RepID=UPI0035DDBBCB
MTLWPPTCSDLPAAGGHAVAAKLSFPPLLPESAHATRTPRVLPTVISLQEHRSPGDGLLTVENLALACEGRRMYLAVPERRHCAEAARMHALTPRNRTPLLVRFLAELPLAPCGQVTVFGWDATAKMPFLPRLRYWRTMLAAALWRLQGVRATRPHLSMGFVGGRVRLLTRAPPAAAGTPR